MHIAVLTAANSVQAWKKPSSFMRWPSAEVRHDAKSIRKLRKHISTVNWCELLPFTCDPGAGSTQAQECINTTLCHTVLK